MMQRQQQQCAAGNAGLTDTTATTTTEVPEFKIPITESSGGSVKNAGNNGEPMTKTATKRRTATAVVTPRRRNNKNKNLVEQQCMFHLRRVQFQPFVKCRPPTEPINDRLEPTKEPMVLSRSTMILLDKQTKIGRNPELVDVVLHSVVHSNMISRDHSEIVGEIDGKGNFVRYFISDRSLNGTYVNDTRVKDLQQLRDGDLIKFGHVNGAAIKPGEFAPQQAAEFIFRFERALPNYQYFGYSSTGVRVQNEQRRAYMQINSDRVLPTEVYSSAAAATAAVVGGGIPAASSSSSSSLVIPSGATINVVNNNKPGTFVAVEPTAAASACTATYTQSVPLPACNNNNNNNSRNIGTAAAAVQAHHHLQQQQQSGLRTVPMPPSNCGPLTSNCSTVTSMMPTMGSTSCFAAPQQSTGQMQNTNNGGNNGNSNNNGTNQLAHLAAVAAATTAAAAAAAANANGGGGGGGGTPAVDQQQQQALNNALNQLGLGGATDEQIAALRSLMSQHDAMSTMERLAAQQQWQKTLLSLNTLQQQNPLIYGHAFPAAAAAAAALFSGIDLNAAAAANANQSAAAAQYAAAASFWPNIRASLQPSVAAAAAAVDWSQQQQQKAAALAQQLQLRLPSNAQQLYQQQQTQSQQQNTTQVAANVSSALFGTTAQSAFSLPNNSNGQQQQQGTTNGSNNHQSSTTGSGNGTPTTVAGLLIAAAAAHSNNGGHQQQSQHLLLPSTSSSTTSSSAAYSSCTTSQPQSVTGIRPPTAHQQQQQQSATVTPLSRNASSSSSSSLHAFPAVPTTPTMAPAASATDQLAAAAVRLAKEALEADQQEKGWPPTGGITITCPTGTNGNTGNGGGGSSKVSPIVAAAAAAVSQLQQRLPADIAQALVAVAVAQQQQQQQQANLAEGSWHQSAVGSTPLIGTPTSSTSGISLANVQQQQLQQPFAQHLLLAAASGAGNNAKNVNNNNGNGIPASITTSTIANCSPMPLQLHSPTLGSLQQRQQQADANSTTSFRDSLCSSTCTSSSLNSSGTSSAFSTPATQQHGHNANNGSGTTTNLSTLTAAMFAAGEIATTNKRHQQEQQKVVPSQQHKRRVSLTGSNTMTEVGLVGSAATATIAHLPNRKADSRRATTGILKREKTDPNLMLSIASPPNMTANSGMPFAKTPATTTTTTTAVISMDCSNGSITSDLDQRQIESKTTAMDMAEAAPAVVVAAAVSASLQQKPLSAVNKGDTERQLMECDSSVPSPPSKRVDEDEDDDEDQEEDNKNRKAEKMDCGQKDNVSLSRKRHSDTGCAPTSITTTAIPPMNKTMTGNGTGGDTKPPRPVKQARKSNEVARLLNDLTAGNCSWQYMAERNQQKAVQFAAKNKDKKQGANNNKDGMKSTAAGRTKNKQPPLRLEDRKRLEMEKKMGHKMMRQISDSESSGAEEETQQKPPTSVPESDDDEDRCVRVAPKPKQQKKKANNTNLAWESPTKGMKANKAEGVRARSTSSSSSTSVPSFHAFGPEWSDEHNSDDDANADGTPKTTKQRKLLSSAPKQKSQTVAKAEVAEPKKRGPKPAAEKKKKADIAASTDGPGRKPNAEAKEIKSSRGRKPKQTAASVANAADSGDENNKKAANLKTEVKPKRGRKAASATTTTTATGAKAKGAQKKKYKKRRNSSDSEDDNNDQDEQNADGRSGSGSPGIEDWTGGAGDPELCAHKKCQRPKMASIEWVQCDQCDKWFHSICVFGNNIAPEEDQWFCSVHCETGCGADDDNKEVHAAVECGSD